MGKAAKTAQRVKVTEREVPCPFCGARTSRPVLFYPERGKPADARGCEKCRKVWHIRTGVLLAEGASL